jgi:hypothetical protein
MNPGPRQSFFEIFPETCILFKFCRSVKVNVTLGGFESALLGIFFSQAIMNNTTICNINVVKYSAIHGFLIGFI